MPEVTARQLAALRPYLVGPADEYSSPEWQKAGRYARKRAKELFPGRKTCFLCGKRIVGKYQVHHKDENHYNNDDDNLSCVHPTCHTVYHHRGKKRSATTRAKISASNSRRVWTPEMLERLREARKRDWERRKSGRSHQTAA